MQFTEQKRPACPGTTRADTSAPIETCKAMAMKFLSQGTPPKLAPVEPLQEFSEEAVHRESKEAVHRELNDMLLVGSVAPDVDATCREEVLAALAAAAPQRVCSTIFSFGDVIWKCKTCQVGDDTCVVCQACFQGGEHDGHDLSFYISRQSDGGCCDCGDESAWAPSGFCTRHGRMGSPVALLDSVPAQLKARAEQLFAAVFELLATLAAKVRAGVPPGRNLLEDAEREHTRHRARPLGWAVSWVTATCVSFDGLCVVISTLLTAGGCREAEPGGLSLLCQLLLSDTAMRSASALCGELPKQVPARCLRCLTLSD